MHLKRPGVVLPGTLLISAFLCSIAHSLEADEQLLSVPRPPAAHSQSESKQLTLPSGSIIVVAEGENEPKSIGSYTIRYYTGENVSFPYDNYVGGMVRPRDGYVEKVAAEDIDGNHEPEIIVTIRSAGTGSYLSADAFSIAGGTVQLFETLSWFPADTDLVDVFREKIRESATGRKIYAGAACSRINTVRQNNLPEKGTTVSLNQIRQICIDYNLPELWTKIEKDPPKKPFQSDGCSYWFGSWQGVSLYSACFLHDLKYWAGYFDEEVERLIADAELMVDVACLLGSTVMAETMFQGTRLGGNELYQRSFSWGFGRE